jgi:hypothetical protein
MPGNGGFGALAAWRRPERHRTTPRACLRGHKADCRPLCRLPGRGAALG